MADLRRQIKVYLRKEQKNMYEKLLEELNARHITRNKLALLAGITSQDIYAVLSGKKFMYPGWKRRIAEALNMPESELFEQEAESEEK